MTTCQREIVIAAAHCEDDQTKVGLHERTVCGGEIETTESVHEGRKIVQTKCLKCFGRTSTSDSVTVSPTV